VLPHVSRWDWRCWRDVIACLEQAQPDVLHIQYQTGAYAMHPAINLLPWRLRGLGVRLPVVVTFHDLLEPYLFPKAGPLRRLVTRRLSYDAQTVIVTNDDDEARLLLQREWLPAQSPLCLYTIPIGSNIPNAPPGGYNRDAWRQRLGIQPEEVVIAYFGLLSRSKGADLLLDACRQLAAHLPLRLLLIGGAATSPADRAYAAALLARIEQAGPGQRIIQTGHCAPAEVSAHLLACDIVALPFRGGASFRSGSLLAALSHGAPVITTHPHARRPTAPGEHIDRPRLVHEENVLLVPRNNSHALAAALQRLARAPELRQRLGSGARRLSTHFRWSEIARQHELIYSAV
jgi:glycosyltransferase involved in cell wall biosynthesis